MKLTTARHLRRALAEALEAARYAKKYRNESQFEEHVWRELIRFAGKHRQITCLTSHKQLRSRLQKDWDHFLREDRGPDINILRSKNRLDFVVRHPLAGSIGIEVKCLGAGRHTQKLTQGLGQALLASAHRDGTLLVIHCGRVSIKEREELRRVADQICRDTKVGIVVVP